MQKQKQLEATSSLVGLTGEVIRFDQDVLLCCGIPKYSTKDNFQKVFRCQSSIPLSQQKPILEQEKSKQSQKTFFQKKNRLQKSRKKQLVKCDGHSEKRSDQQQKKKKGFYQVTGRKDIFSPSVLPTGKTDIIFSESKIEGENKSTECIKEKSYPYSPSYWCSTEMENSKNSSCNSSALAEVNNISDSKLYLKDNVEELDHSVSISSNKDLVEATINPIQKAEISIVLELRSKWLLDSQWLDKSLEELLKSLQNFNNTSRLEAVTASTLIIMKNEKDNKWMRKCGEWREDVIKEMQSLLNDNSNIVAFAAALCLQLVNQSEEKVVSILRKTAKSGEPSERWISTQCLTMFNIFDDCVLKELISHVNGNDSVKHEKTLKLLKRLDCSQPSTVSFFTEKLNSSRWKDKLTACQVLSLLDIKWKSKDLGLKLLYLIWNDWNKEVRVTATKCIGATGHGELFHNALCERLRHGEYADQVDALKKISCLGIVTPQIYLALHECLKTKSDILCLYVIKTVGTLKLQKACIIETLCKFVLEHSNWRIRLCAIKALGLIGVSNLTVRECLLWAIRFEKRALVRAEACSSVRLLNMNDPEVICTLQDAIITEEESIVKSKLAIALYGFSAKPVRQHNMLTMVKEIIHRQSTKDIILKEILPQEFLENYRYVIEDSSENIQIKELRSRNSDFRSSRPSEMHGSSLTKSDDVRHTLSDLEYPALEQSFIPHWVESFASLASID